MMHPSYKKSYIVDTFFNSTSGYQSTIITTTLGYLNTFIDICARKMHHKYLLTVWNTLPQIKTALLFLFVVSLTLAPDSSVQISSVSSSTFNAGAINQRQFGINIFSLSNFLLIPLTILFIQQYKHSKRKFVIKKMDLYLILLLIIGIICSIVSYNFQASFVWTLKLLYGVGIYIIFSQIELKKQHITAILYAFLTIIFLEGFLAMGQFMKNSVLGLPIESLNRFTLNRVVYTFQGVTNFKAIGTFSHPNQLSTYLALLLPAILTLLLVKNKMLKAVAFAAIGVQILTLFTTYSRWGVCTNLFSFFCTVFLWTKYAKFKISDYSNAIKLLLLVALSIGVIGILNPTMAQRFLRFSESDGSLLARLDLYSQYMYVIRQNPLGIGGGSFITYTANYDFTERVISNRYLVEVHNLYFLLLIDIGIGGFIIFLLYVATIFKLFWKNIRHVDPTYQLLCISLFASIITYLFNGIWEPRPLTERVGFLFFVLVGLLVNILNRKIPTDH